jgi:hypothetical protein
MILSDLRAGLPAMVDSTAGAMHTLHPKVDGQIVEPETEGEALRAKITILYRSSFSVIPEEKDEEEDADREKKTKTENPLLLDETDPEGGEENNAFPLPTDLSGPGIGANANGSNPGGPAAPVSRDDEYTWTIPLVCERGIWRRDSEIEPPSIKNAVEHALRAQ